MAGATQGISNYGMLPPSPGFHGAKGTNSLMGGEQRAICQWGVLNPRARLLSTQSTARERPFASYIVS